MTNRGAKTLQNEIYFRMSYENCCKRVPKYTLYIILKVLKGKLLSPPRAIGPRGTIALRRRLSVSRIIENVPGVAIATVVTRRGLYICPGRQQQQKTHLILVKKI